MIKFLLELIIGLLAVYGLFGIISAYIRYVEDRRMYKRIEESRENCCSTKDRFEVIGKEKIAKKLKRNK